MDSFAQALFWILVRGTRWVTSINENPMHGRQTPKHKPAQRPNFTLGPDSRFFYIELISYSRLLPTQNCRRTLTPFPHFLMKKLLKLLAAGTVLTAALLPATVTNVSAASYYPGYTCYYRDIAGSCLSYQTQNPYFFDVSNTSYRSPYGNRQTYPFNAMFNASSVQQSPWDNRNSNNYYRSYRYEEDDDDNDYIDEDDDGYRYYYGDSYEKNDGQWKWYFDEDDDTYNRYRYQSDDDYYNHSNHPFGFGNNKNTYEEYEYTRYFCTGRDCQGSTIRY